MLSGAPLTTPSTIPLQNLGSKQEKSSAFDMKEIQRFKNQGDTLWMKAKELEKNADDNEDDAEEYFDKAFEQYKRCLVLVENISAETFPPESENFIALAYVFKVLGDACYARGEYETSVLMYTKFLAMDSVLEHSSRADIRAIRTNRHAWLTEEELQNVLYFKAKAESHLLQKTSPQSAFNSANAGVIQQLFRLRKKSGRFLDKAECSEQLLKNQQHKEPLLNRS